MDSLQAFWNATVAFGNHLSQVGFGMLAVGLAFHLANLLLRSLAWRNILRAALPNHRVRWRPVAGAYLAGVGINSIAPARGGDVMKIYLSHRELKDAPYTTITTSLIAETLFDVVVGAILLAWAATAGVLPSVPDLSSLNSFEWTFFADHSGAFLTVVALLMIAGGLWFAWIEHHVTRFWERVEAGLAILRTPKRYLREVVSLQALGWCLRVASMYAFMRAFHIGGGVLDAAFALCIASISTAIPFTPGGAGPQQALLVYGLRNLATSSAVLAFSVGMQFTVTLFNVILGGICMAVMLRRMPWRTGVPPVPDGDAVPVKPA